VAAYFRNMSYWWDQTHNWWLTTGTLHVTDRNCYDGTNLQYTASTSSSYNRWRNFFQYGSPGRGTIEPPAPRVRRSC